VYIQTAAGLNWVRRLGEKQRAVLQPAGECNLGQINSLYIATRVVDPNINKGWRFSPLAQPILFYLFIVPFIEKVSRSASWTTSLEIKALLERTDQSTFSHLNKSLPAAG